MVVIVLILNRLPGLERSARATTATSIDSSQVVNRLSPSKSAQQLLQQGREYYAVEQFDAAITVWSAAEQQLVSQSDTLNRVVILSNLALAYRHLGQWSDADTMIQQSLALIESFQGLTTQGLRVYGQLLNTQGSLYLARGQAQQALTAWEQATDMYTKADYPEGIVKSLINQTYALRRLGFASDSYSRLSRVESLLANQANGALKVVLLNSLGDNQRLLGNLEASQTSLNKGLQLAEELSLSTKSAAIRLSLGNTLQLKAHYQEALAMRTRSKTDLAKATRLYQQALDTYRAISTQAAIAIRIQAQLNQLKISIHRQDWATASSLGNALPSQLEVLPIGRTSIFAHLKLAHLLLDACITNCPTELRDAQQQIYSLLVTAREQAAAVRDPIAESYALGYLGHLYEIKNQYREANRLTRAALQKTINQPSLIYQWEWQLGRIERGRDRENALQHYEAAFQAVQTVRSDIIYVGPDIQFDFRDRIEPLYREYISLLLPKSDITWQDDPTQLLQAKLVIDDLRVAELESFLACGLIAPDDNVARASIQQIANTDQTTAVMYPIIVPDGPGRDRLEVLLQLPNQAIRRYPSRSVLADSTGRIDSAIEQKLDRLRQILERPAYILSTQDRLLAEEIYDWLIRPAEEQGLLEPVETLVFVLDGAFRNVPMAALYDKQTNQFLIEKYAIAVTFGDLEIPQASPEKELSVLAAGLSLPSVLPENTNSTNVSESDTARNIAFTPLPHVEEELESIIEIVDDTESLLNLAFKKKNFQTRMSSSTHNVVHLATHGVFGFTRDETFLLVAAPDAAVQEEGQSRQRIKVGKIDLNDFDSLLKTRNQTPLELLVLSACETATGDSRELLGIAGLAVQSGARSTLATLWRINDLSTSLLMRDFYEQLISRGVSKAKALQQAQIKLLKENRHPSQWAPYLLVGDWR